jgi:hypothetical protein
MQFGIDYLISIKIRGRSWVKERFVQGALEGLNEWFTGLEERPERVQNSWAKKESCIYPV